MPAVRYASGKVARAVCDRCSLAGRYLDMVTEQTTGLRVHHACADVDAELLRRPKRDPIYLLRHPRPDVPLVLAVDAVPEPGGAGEGPTPIPDTPPPDDPGTPTPPTPPTPPTITYDAGDPDGEEQEGEALDAGLPGTTAPPGSIDDAGRP